MKSKKRSLSRRRFLGYSGTAVGAILAGGTSNKAAGLGDDQIVRVAIYPGIGIARVGNSVARDGFYIGPETVNPPLTLENQMRDSNGALKRQAARFRVYGFNQRGEVVREITAKDAQIEWTVELANKKSSWYRFIAALDIPEASDLKSSRRNPLVKGADRAGLEITPGAKSITGTSKSGVQCDGGKFNGVAVNLGELRTDRDGRLLVLGGTGKAGSPSSSPVFNPEDPDTFNNADGWWDDTSDGPVSATVKIGGRTLIAESSWVAVAPPNYAPDVIGWRTMYDLLMDTYEAAGMVTPAQQTSFTRDVLPVLQRLSGLQWVNKGFADMYGRGGELDFENPVVIQKLSKFPTEPDGFENFRKHIYESFRLVNSDTSNKRLWPMLYGDAYGTFENSPAENFVVQDARARHLKNWAEGKFVSDYDPAQKPRVFNSLEEVPVSAQPDMLNRAAMHFCLADAFHPGCELTWPMRWASMYSKPFRIRRRKSGELAKDLGDELTQSDIFTRKGPGLKQLVPRADGPLNAQEPGGLTRWMAIPWHGDTVFCRSGYDAEFDPYLPTFWPARVPNHVLSEQDYKIVIDETKPRQERLEAFRRRKSWVRGLRGGAAQQMLQMIGDFDNIGVLEARRGVRGDAELPAVMLVESLPFRLATVQESVQMTEERLRKAGEKAMDHLVETPAEKAGWDDEAQLKEFRDIRMRRKKKP